MNRLALIHPLLVALPFLVPSQAPKPTPPPGMVLIPGGTTWIGTDRALLEKVSEDNDARFKRMANETPQFQMQVESFYLGVTEVTNEQYAEYVKATGAKPPDGWGIKAIDAAAIAHAAELGAKRKGRPRCRQAGPKLDPFDQVQWWNDHWREAQWEIPAGQETAPVGYVDYREAESYARWAGVRLQTEFEFQRAGRGDTKNTYPWGDKWDPTLCANGGQGLKGAKPVGSYPNGKTEQGVHDLSGNVWEWTSSPFVEYPGFKVIRYKRGKETVEALVEWNASRRVVVSGSYATEPSAARLSTRRPTDPSQSAEAMGLRVAASVQPGVDMANCVMRDGLDKFPAEVKYDAKKCVAADLWRSAPGKAPVPAYAVTLGYDYVLFVPAVELDFTSLGQMEQHSLEKGPVHLGVISASKAMLSPALPAGSYAVALRGAGPLKPHETIFGAIEAAAPANGKQGMALQDPPKPAEKDKAKPKKDDVRPVLYPEGFEPDKRALLFYDEAMKVVGWVPIERAEFVTPTKTSVEVAETRQNFPKNGVNHQVEVCSVKLQVNSWVKVSNKGLGFHIPLAFAPGSVTAEWRK
ncbi:MAG: SUMF1/EgtB/PvdO family nonheme iron enzyme [Planctomycetes bacterium]|nr:SUMF1/EgtB/PvdO family nonheme iron enzyme [Planctomycetota bacterium]